MQNLQIRLRILELIKYTKKYEIAVKINSSAGFIEFKYHFS